MKRFILVLFTALVLSCEALPFNFSTGGSWLINEDGPNANRAALTVLGVDVDRTGGWDSVERETAALAPLYFWDQGCVVVSAEEKPGYAVWIHLREREFSRNWQTKKSLAVEVRIWPYEDAPEAGTPFYEQKLPLAVGRVVRVGEKSFSSSETTGQMLSKAIEKAVKKIVEHERRKQDA